MKKADDMQGSRDWRYGGARNAVAVSAMDWAARIVSRTDEIAGCSSLLNTTDHFECLTEENRQSE
jgi:hypothetical protein